MLEYKVNSFKSFLIKKKKTTLFKYIMYYLYKNTNFYNIYLRVLETISKLSIFNFYHKISSLNVWYADDTNTYTININNLILTYL